VAHFRSASFDLDEESVGLALQCCLGGDMHGFQVVRLSDHWFRFSVASNLVGHFIYRLESRIWPDFHITFHLFHGDPSSSVFRDISRSVVDQSEGWTSPHGRGAKQKSDVPQSIAEPAVNALNSVRFTPDLGFLKQSAELENSKVVASNSLRRSPELVTSADVLRLGCFEFPISRAKSSVNGRFFGRAVQILNSPYPWPDFSTESAPMLEVLRDLRTANYSDDQIKSATDISFLPEIGSSQVACPLCLGPGFYCHQNGLVCVIGLRCRYCTKKGHIMRDCPVFCSEFGQKISVSEGGSMLQHVSVPGSEKYQNAPLKDSVDSHSSLVCPRCLMVGHVLTKCTNRICCLRCKEEGHVRATCKQKFVWKVKHKQISPADLTPPAPLAYSSEQDTPNKIILKRRCSCRTGFGSWLCALAVISKATQLEIVQRGKSGCLKGRNLHAINLLRLVLTFRLLI
jgi:hypothetical protein